MRTFTDSTGRSILLPAIPQKIISLVPSITELLCSLGLEDRIAGITRYCIFPAHLQDKKTVIGGTKKTVTERMCQLSPDLILASKEENIREEIERYEKDFPVYVTDVSSLSDAIEMIVAIGEMTHTEQKAVKMAEDIAASFQVPPSSPRIRAAYLIWNDPIMTIGSDTFIHDMMEHAGLENVFNTSIRYPIVTIEDIVAKQPAVILLSSEPYPFREKHLTWFRENFPNTRVVLANGTYFSWYGSRLLNAAAYFRSEILPAINSKE